MVGLLDTLDDLAMLIARAEKSVHGRTFDELVANDEAYDALTCRLAMIGKPAKDCRTTLKPGILICRGAKWRRSATSPAMIISVSMLIWFGRRQ
jgi:hypothetical protein